MVDTMRYWDGKSWTNDISRAGSERAIKAAEPAPFDEPDSPVGVIVGGFVVGLVGGVLVVAGSGEEGSELLALLGAALLGVGSIISMIGVIAAGVRLGIRHGDWERAQRR